MEKINYSRKDYEDDLLNPSLPHIKNREHFKAFYDELGKDPAQYVQTYYAPLSNFIVPKGRILELGCHWGFNLIHWARQGFYCVGLELSEGLVDYGIGKIAQESKEVRERITLLRGWIEDFVPPEKYDTVVLTEVLEHVMDPLIIMQKAAECLTLDGLLYISAPAQKTGNYSHVRSITQQDIEYLLNHSGLKVFSWNQPLIESGNTALIAKLKE
jgi:2-polyprenyl-6-hydroxyphenyl methylase/3-demethylubiquinone-9 3-methyltransferase